MDDKIILELTYTQATNLQTALSSSLKLHADKHCNDAVTNSLAEINEVLKELVAKRIGSSICEYDSNN